MKDIRIKNAVEEFLIAKAADGFSENSIEINRWALSRLIDYTGNLELRKIDLNTLRGFMGFMRKEYRPHRGNGDISPLANSSVDRISISIRAFFRWSELEFGIDRPDLRLPKPRYKPEVIKPFSQDEIKAILGAAERTDLIQRVAQRPFRMKRKTTHLVSPLDPATLFGAGTQTGVRPQKPGHSPTR